MDSDIPLLSEFAAAYTEHHNFIFRYIMGRIHNRATAEDLTSETFTRAWARIEHYKPHPDGMGPWLTTIARNLILDHLKSSYNQLVTPVYDMWDAEVIEEEPPDDPRLEILPRVMGVLTDKQRECVELSKTMTNTQIAEATGNTRRAVTVLKVRAHKQLRKAIEQALAAA
jgi:RNA polymerase sigma-70 factor (ECF subfamily)